MITFIFDFLLVFHVMEIGNVEFVQMRRILEGDDVLSGERLVRQQFLPILGLQVELFNGFVWKNVAGGANGHNVRLVGELLEKNGTVVGSFRILVHVES